MRPTSPSFDHQAPVADRPQHARRAEHPIEAQIRRNGQMKYRRTQAVPGSVEIVMPDGEVIVQPAPPADARTPGD